MAIGQRLPAVRFVAPPKRQKANSSLIEDDYVACFKCLLDRLPQFSPNAQPPTHVYTLYDYKNCQNARLNSSPLKPDIVFYRGTSAIRDFKDIHFVLGYTC